MPKNSDTIVKRIKNSRYDISLIPEGILNAVDRAGIKIFVVEDGGSCYYHLGKGILVVSVQQSLLYCNRYPLTLSQAIESIICHELGHHLMFLAEIPQPQNRYTERLAWLLGRQFLHLTNVPSAVYTLLTIEVN